MVLSRTARLLRTKDLRPALPMGRPTKFVHKDGPRLKQIQHNTHEVVYKRADDSGKTLAQTPAIIDAFTRAVLDKFKDHAVHIPESVQEANNQFGNNEGVSEKDVFHDQFEFTEDSSDTVPVADIKERVRELGLVITPQYYNKWLRAKQCTCKKWGPNCVGWGSNGSMTTRRKHRQVGASVGLASKPTPAIAHPQHALVVQMEQCCSATAAAYGWHRRRLCTRRPLVYTPTQ
jgi:hypothetical protein